MAIPPHKPLKLLAQTAKGLEVISACTQDSLVPLHGLHYNKSAKSFHVACNRYKWETHHQKASSSSHSGHRVSSGLSFHNVEKVEYSGFDPEIEKHNTLYLLSLRHQPPYVQMDFAQEAKIRLTAPKLKAKLHDADQEPWPALKPDHKIV